MVKHYLNFLFNEGPQNTSTLIIPPNLHPDLFLIPQFWYFYNFLKNTDNIFQDIYHFICSPFFPASQTMLPASEIFSLECVFRSRFGESVLVLKYQFFFIWNVFIKI